MYPTVRQIFKDYKGKHLLFHKNGNTKYRRESNEYGVNRECWFDDNMELHREFLPAEIIYDYVYHGDVLVQYVKEKTWYNHGKIHREGAPAYIKYDDDETVMEYQWFIDDELHRTNGPAIIIYDNNKIAFEKWYNHGKCHREDGPAAIIHKFSSNGFNIYEHNVIEEWIVNDKTHRECGPARIEYTIFDDNPNLKVITTEEWFVNDQRHRDNGPAILNYYKNGKVQMERWAQHGEGYRIFGPNVIRYNEDGTVDNLEWTLKIKNKLVSITDIALGVIAGLEFDINFNNWTIEDKVYFKFQLSFFIGDKNG